MPEIKRDGAARKLQVWIGVDPGGKGGLAALNNLKEFNGCFDVRAMPDSDRDVWRWFSSGADFVRQDGGEVFAVLERNTGYVGGEGNPGSGMYKFGMNAGALRMALTAAQIPFEEVQPQVWQKALGIAPRRKGKEVVRKVKGKRKKVVVGAESKDDFKKRLRSVAQRLFPKIEVNLGTCDAILIAEFCRRQRLGLL